MPGSPIARVKDAVTASSPPDSWTQLPAPLLDRDCDRILPVKLLGQPCWVPCRPQPIARQKHCQAEIRSQEQKRPHWLATVRRLNDITSDTSRKADRPGLTLTAARALSMNQQHRSRPPGCLATRATPRLVGTPATIALATASHWKWPAQSPTPRQGRQVQYVGAQPEACDLCTRSRRASESPHRASGRPHARDGSPVPTFWGLPLAVQYARREVSTWTLILHACAGRIARLPSNSQS